jgi:hypothetical protein
MGKRLIITESEKNSILNMHNEFKNNSTILEQQKKGKLFFAFDNDTTDFQGFIGSDGYLYPYAEDFSTWKIGPILKVPYTGPVAVTIDKRNGKEVIMVGKSFNSLSKLEIDPKYTVKTVDYKSIPKK